MAFSKGQSGNPGGKSKIQGEFEKRCREFMSEEGWKTLSEFARDRDKRVRMWALEQMMLRGFGRPTEFVDVTTRDESAYSPDGLAAEIRQLVGGAEAKSGTSNLTGEASA
jgi:hypothetical protein